MKTAFLILALALSSPLVLATDLGDGIRLTPKTLKKKFPHCEERRDYYEATIDGDATGSQRLSIMLSDAVQLEQDCSTDGPGDEEACTAPYSFRRTIESYKKIGSFLVLKVRTTSYMCGAHENYGFATRVLDVKRGQVVLLDNLLVPGGSLALDELVTAKVGKKASKPLKISLDQVHPDGSGFSVQFNPYEVGSFADGAPVYKFTATEARKVFRDSTDARALFGI